MKYTKLTPEKLRSYLVGVFAEKDSEKMYNKNCQMYVGLDSFPLTRPAFVEDYGEAAVIAAEEGARAELEACRREYEATTWPACFDAADAHRAAGSPMPAEGEYVWGETSHFYYERCGGVAAAIYNRVHYTGGRTAAHTLLHVAKVITISAEDLNRPEHADELCAAGVVPGGTLHEEDTRIKRGAPRGLELHRVAVITDGVRYYCLDSQGGTRSGYIFLPAGWQEMFADLLQSVTRAKEEKEAERAAVAARERAENLARYKAKCNKWAKYMRPVTSLIAAKEAAKAAHGFKSTEYKVAARKLNAARRANILAMCRRAFPHVKFSLTRHDGWGYSWMLTYSDGPTEEAFKAATDLDLFVTHTDTYDGMEDYADVVMRARSFCRFCYEFLGDDNTARGVKVEREMSAATRADLEARVIAALPELANGGEIDRADLTDEQRDKIQTLRGDGDLGNWMHFCAATIARAAFDHTDFTPAADTAAKTADPAADCPPAPAADDMPPAEGLYLYRVPADGVAVGGPASATYCARKSIRAHGARWNKGAQRWEAFTPEAINALCEWFGVTASRIA